MWPPMAGFLLYRNIQGLCTLWHVLVLHSFAWLSSIPWHTHILFVLPSVGSLRGVGHWRELHLKAGDQGYDQVRRISQSGG